VHRRPEAASTGGASKTRIGDPGEDDTPEPGDDERRRRNFDAYST
jgi:hypothetical protein